MSSEHKDGQVEIVEEKPAGSPNKDHKEKSLSSPEGSPMHPRKFPFKIPSPVPTRRTRTSSQ